MRNYKFWEKYSGNTLWQKVSGFVENHELTCGLTDEAQDEFANDLIGLIEQVKEFVAEETDKESLREDVRGMLVEHFGEQGESLFKLLPLKVVDELIDDWQDDLSDNDHHVDARDGLLYECLFEQSWMANFDELDEKDVEAYFAYLQEWFLTHNEGNPVGIKEFLQCEMQDIVNMEQELIEKIVDRAQKLKVLKMDREVAVAFMELASKHYDLSLEKMLNGSDFDFMHDFVYMPQHFHKETGTFDNQFVPRFSKQSLDEV